MCHDMAIGWVGLFSLLLPRPTWRYSFDGPRRPWLVLLLLCGVCGVRGCGACVRRKRGMVAHRQFWKNKSVADRLVDRLAWPQGVQRAWERPHPELPLRRSSSSGVYEQLGIGWRPVCGGGGGVG